MTEQKIREVLFLFKTLSFFKTLAHIGPRDLKKNKEDATEWTTHQGICGLSIFMTTSQIEGPAVDELIPLQAVMQNCAEDVSSIESK